jgi:type VI secretion system protein ImpE
MTPKELLDAGRLDEAVQELTQQVRNRPADTRLRVFLFELLCFEGEFDRAGKQLEVIASQGDGMDTELAIQVYRDLIAAEKTRQQVFHNGALPKFLLPPPPYADQYVMLVKKLAKTPREAVSLLAAAEEQFPAISGQLGDRSFSTFRDADDRVAPVLEVFHGANYLWVPIEQIRRLQVSEPKSLRDLIWAHARIETYEESVGDVFVPALYVDTPASRDSQVRLGRLTEWQAVDDQLVYGAGPRVFLVDNEETSLLELRDVRFESAAHAGEA